MFDLISDYYALKRFFMSIAGILVGGAIAIGLVILLFSLISEAISKTWRFLRNFFFTPSSEIYFLRVLNPVFIYNSICGLFAKAISREYKKNEKKGMLFSLFYLVIYLSCLYTNVVDFIVIGKYHIIANIVMSFFVILAGFLFGNRLGNGNNFGKEVLYFSLVIFSVIGLFAPFGLRDMTLEENLMGMFMGMFNALIFGVAFIVFEFVFVVFLKLFTSIFGITRFDRYLDSY